MWSHIHKKEIDESMKWFKESFTNRTKWIKINNKEVSNKLFYIQNGSGEMRLTGMDAQYAVEKVQKSILLLFNNRQHVEFYTLTELVESFTNELLDGSYCMESIESLEDELDLAIYYKAPDKHIKAKLSRDPLFHKYINFRIWMEEKQIEGSVTYDQFKWFKSYFESRLVEKDDNMIIWI